MKTTTLLLALSAVAILPLTAASCQKQKGPAERVGEKIDDALDRRPGEKVKDAAEDVQDAAKDAADAVKDAVK